MIKRFFASLVIIFALVCLGAGYAVFRRQSRPHPQPVKAEEVQVRIIEGWNVADIGNYLKNNNLGSAQNFILAEKSFDISGYPLLKSKPKNADLEGFLYPDTYRIYKPKDNQTASSTDQLITKMLNNFSVKFTPEMAAQAEKGKMSIYEIITLASIIEKETGRRVDTDAQRQSLDDERKIIAGIFYNRLNTNVALESDATVNYVTGKFDAGVSKADTEINSPYNTYKYRGLPPGPICNPSQSSILAALYPTDTDYFYFLHDQKTGQAIYAKTYEQHLANKQKYLK